MKNVYEVHLKHDLVKNHVIADSIEDVVEHYSNSKIVSIEVEHDELKVLQ